MTKNRIILYTISFISAIALFLINPANAHACACCATAGIWLEYTNSLENYDNELTLSNLKQLETLNGLTFKKLLPSRQRHFKRTTIRMIALSKEIDEEAEKVVAFT
ncbi:hypothetical protein [Planktothrix agardhii]|jgi:hypothetical protein|uniref:hypothetical protein n=1 Tax=Planktothrix agardhii TaxID=1160 RepID=UPI000DBB78BD|nr:hypothetical protein [Planktothrix agardhii]MCF3608988.1 hypothetical protein [Planktothrix agardhii 1033]BBD57068.1 hypothetical protein NIES204_44040 [Planktothrix agardhii NIES-204]MCB8788921.1 hypothetical protein [Planktothrix agardhii 1025]MCF3614231.1 hypothetical protein [Planktothrix agardhii 1027]MCF3647840.1 hypothetical protein [Planktothrix agardhii 1026]